MSPSWAREKTSSRLTLRAWRRASASVLSRLARSWASWRARRSFSTAWTNSPASQTPSKPSTSTGIPGPAASTRSPVKSCIARTRPHCGPATSESPTLQRAALDQDGDDRAAARVELGLDHGARGGRVGVGAELLQLGDEQDHVEQVVEPLVGLGGDVAVDRRPRPTPPG